jgi:hypothetical protein
LDDKWLAWSNSSELVIPIKRTKVNNKDGLVKGTLLKPVTASKFLGIG